MSMYTLRSREILTITVSFSLFLPFGLRGTACFRPMRHIASTHYSHNPALPTTRSDRFLWATTSSCCFNALSSSRNTCCSNTGCCCQGKNVMLPASPRRQEVSSVHPQRYEGVAPTFTQGKAPYNIIRPRRVARNAPYKRCCFWRITTQEHPNMS